MKPKRWVRTACLVAACGCAGTTAETKGQAEQKPPTMLVCEMERPTGSMIRQRVCRRQEISDANRRDAEELLRKGRVQIEKSN